MKKRWKRMLFLFFEGEYNDIPKELLQGVRARCVGFLLGAVLFLVAAIALPVFLASVCLAGLVLFCVEALPYLLAVMSRNYIVLSDAKILTGTNTSIRTWGKRTREILFIDQKTDQVYSMQVPRGASRYAEGTRFSCVLTKDFTDGSGICHGGRFLSFHPISREILG